ncbi:uncharacterized protein METZ01_LOCUS253288 [marine metagenome]|uniref:Uncharacterized protein n=1 Tax=marine metagenome TaxID=408172 RepID=A0A382IKZ6_9ZZZZ
MLQQTMDTLFTISKLYFKLGDYFV